MNFDYYEYLLLLAMDLNLCCSDNKSISIEDFKKFRKVLLNKLEEVVTINAKKLIIEQKECFVNFSKLNSMLTPLDERLLIENFLDKYHEYFYLEDADTISVKIEDEDFIDEIVELEDQLFSKFSIIERTACQVLENIVSSKEIIEIFNIKEMPRVVNKLALLECALENNYNVLDEKSLKENERLLNSYITQIYEDINYNSAIFYSDYISNTFESEPLILYSDGARKNLFFNDHAYLEENDGTFYKAIFTDEYLFADRISTTFDLGLLENQVIDDDDEYEEENEDYDETINMEGVDEGKILALNFQSDIIFFLMYYKTINNYANLYGDENQRIYKIQRRLLYLINGYGYQIYNIDGINKLLNSLLQEGEFTSKLYQRPEYCMSIMFLIDIFKCNNIDNNTYLKILFVKNYVDVTKDTESILLFMQEYINNEKYNEIYSAIFENGKISLENNKIR